MEVTLVCSDKEYLAYELITAARAIGDEVVFVAINDEKLARTAADRGVRVLNIMEDIVLADTAAIASAIKQAADKVNAATVLLSSNRRFKEIAGRLAQQLNGACLTNINTLKNIEGKLVCTRNSLGGATIATYEVNKTDAVIALSPKAFPTAAISENGSIEDFKVNIVPTLKLLETRLKSNSDTNIENAEVLIGVGMGFKQLEDLAMAEVLATALGGELGCSKPIASDRKWMTEERVIGLSGKICKPNLAVLLGISGQVQFAVGVRDAKTVIVINEDENANAATALADYLFVGDIYQVVPALTKLLL